MAYTDNKAKGRDSLADLNNPKADLQSDARLSAPASNQEQETDRGVKTVNPDSNKFDSGNQVKVGPNTMGTGTLKDPLNSYQNKTYPAVVNPDPVADRTGNNKAAGRNIGRPKL